MSAALSVPTPGGSIELGPGSGKCITEGCGVKGGGLLEFTVHEVDAPRPARFNLCGKHLALAVAEVLKP